MSGSTLKSWSIAFGLLMAVFACATATPLVDPEVFRDMAFYRDGGYEDDPVRVGQWGVGALYYGFIATPSWGIQGALVLKYLLGFGIAVACHGLAVRKRVGLYNFAFMAIVALCIAMPIEMAQLRASLVSVALLIGLLHLIHADSSNGGFWIWLSIPLMALWVNIHGSVVIGMGILASYVYSRVCEQYCQSRSLFGALSRDMYLMLVMAACAIGLSANPVSWQVYGQLTSEVLSHDTWISGNAPIWTLPSLIAQLSFLLAFAIAGYGILRSNPWPIFESIALALVAIFAILKAQYIPHFVALWLCLVPPLVERTAFNQLLHQLARRGSSHIAVVAASFGMVAMSFSFNVRPWANTGSSPFMASAREPLSVFPAGAISYLQSAPVDGWVFAPYDATGYVRWKLAPAIDIRSDHELNSEYATRNREAGKRSREAADEWVTSLRDSNIGAILIPVDAPLYKGMTQSAELVSRFEWRKVYDDRTYAIFVRNDTNIRVAERE